MSNKINKSCSNEITDQNTKINELRDIVNNIYDDIDELYLYTEEIKNQNDKINQLQYVTLHICDTIDDLHLDIDSLV
jgi:glutamine synthetase type III